MQNTAGKIPLAITVLLLAIGELLINLEILYSCQNRSDTFLCGSCLCVQVKRKMDV